MKLTCSAFIIVHKNAHLMRPAVESLTAQTRQPDTASILVTDGEYKTVREVTQIGEPYRLLTVPSIDPLTCAASKNWAASLAKADCFFTLDADDYLEPRFVESCMVRLERGADVCGCNYYLQPPCQPRHHATLPLLADIQQANPLPSCSIVRKAAYARTQGFLDILYDDWAMWLRLTKIGCRLERVPEPLFTYVRHAAALTQPEKHPLAMEQLRKAGLV